VEPVYIPLTNYDHFVHGNASVAETSYSRTRIEE
jgi:hypothetical protein